MSLSELDEIIQRLRYVSSGDIIEASDHNNLVDAVKKIREILGTIGAGVSPCIALTTPFADYYIRNGLVSIDDAVKCIKDYWNPGTWAYIFDQYLSVDTCSNILNYPGLDPRYAVDILLSHRLSMEKALRIAYRLNRIVGLGAYINWNDTTPYYWWDTPDTYHAIEIDKPEPGYKRVYKASGGTRGEYDILFKVVPDTFFGACPDDPNYARIIFVGEVGMYCSAPPVDDLFDTVITRQTTTQIVPTDIFIDHWFLQSDFDIEEGSYKNKVATIIEVDRLNNNFYGKVLGPNGQIVDVKVWYISPASLVDTTVSIFVGLYVLRDFPGYEQWVSINKDFQVIIRAVETGGAPPRAQYPM